MNKGEYLRETVELVSSIETRFLELGSRLWKIKTDQLWVMRYETYEDFLESARIKPSVASILTRVYDTYVVIGGSTIEKLKGIGYSNLYEAIPLLKENSVETVINMAKTLTRNEIQQETREEMHGDCKHEKIICICATCKKRLDGPKND